jgi:hypothetical protein
MTRPAASQPFSTSSLESEERTDVNKAKVMRLLLALAVVLVTVSGCGNLYCGVPQGGNVSVLGGQNNR